METFTPQILRFDSLASTNLEAARRASEGAAEGLCVVADEQTAGRGRLRRQWVSPKGAGLYFSILLRPQFELSSWPLLTLMASVARPRLRCLRLVLWRRISICRKLFFVCTEYRWAT